MATMPSSPSYEEPSFHDRRASLASSTGSTVSCKNSKYLYNKVPAKPDENDEKKWGQFLLAYQRGDWEAIGSCANQCSMKARKVQQTDGRWVDNRGEYLSTKTSLIVKRLTQHHYLFRVLCQEQASCRTTTTKRESKRAQRSHVSDTL